jgi:hypothetical protein
LDNMVAFRRLLLKSMTKSDDGMSKARMKKDTKQNQALHKSIAARYCRWRGFFDGVGHLNDLFCRRVASRGCFLLPADWF